MDTHSFEIGPIRPPSEAYSLLVRATRSCPWNRCKFCCTYKGQKFELRTVEEIKQDIDAAKTIQSDILQIAWQQDDSMNIPAAAFDYPSSAAYQQIALWMSAGGESAFLQDANTLVMRTGELAEIIRYLKQTFPTINRITSYGRANTAAKKKLEELQELQQAGLSRLHMGLESGYDPLLQYIDKGVTAEAHIAAGKKVVASGISLSEYVILGLGGKDMWREHALETARVLNEINPAFIRVRTLAINRGMTLYDEMEKGSFVRLTDEEILQEERLLLENLTCQSNFVSDHITNLLQEIDGKLPHNKERFLAVIDKYFALPPQERLNFRVGRRVGIYNELAEIENAAKHEAAEQVVRRFGEVDEKTIQRITSRFIS